ncbi:MAG: DEAD/DEAH box helicase [Rhizobiales bacterium]|nr:DEAD/DEAH box helicase [Hyphomicrobiales bacterium]
MKFSDLGLSPKVLAAVEAAGYTAPTEIQSNAIPFALKGRDVLGIAQTGTGKTAAFVLPMLTRFETGRTRARMPRSLILEPTRELAAQVAEALETYGDKHKLSVALLIGGVSFADQNKILDRGADIVIATPGRLLDHVERGKLMLNACEILVVDEADRMLDMGFIPDIERIFKLTPFTRQTLFFSATMPPEIQRLTDAFLHTPERIEVARPSTTAATIEQLLVRVPSDAAPKRDAFRKLLNSLDIATALIFCNRKRDVRVLLRSMEKHKFDVGAIHGDMDQHARMETLERFRSGKLKFLVASDVAARGLDIPAVSHVFNFDVPYHAEDYVHRIGRTGRAGRKGEAFTLVTSAERKSLAAIEHLIGKKIEWNGQSQDGDSVQAAVQVVEESQPAEASEPAEASQPAAEETKSQPARRGRRGGSGRTRERDQTRAASDTKKPAQKKSSKPSPAREKKDARDDVVFADTADVPAFLRRPITVA